MHLKTILNKVCPMRKFKYGNAKFTKIVKGDAIEITIDPRKNSKPTCSVCNKPGSIYDTSKEVRKFNFVPLWGFIIIFCYRMRRVNCLHCKSVIVESVPWSDGKTRMTNIYMAFLASWAEDLPWSRVADRFKTTWKLVSKSVRWVVDFGLENRDLSEVTSIGVDEVKFHKKGTKFLTVVYQLDSGMRRLLWVGKYRTKICFRKFFEDMEEKKNDFCSKVEFICSDMWKAYLTVAAEKLPNALHILDRFHIAGKFSKALDDVRREEVNKLKENGDEPVLSKTRWIFLKKKDNLCKEHKFKLKDLLKMNLRVVKAYILVEQFDHFWTYKSVTWAEKFMNEWTKRAMYSKIEPIKKVAKTLRNHHELILNWFRAKGEINNGISEGLNLNVKLAFRKARGFRTYETAEVALYHQLGKLPKPKFHRDLW